MSSQGTVTRNAQQPVIRISTGHFSPDRFDEVKRLLEESAVPLTPAILGLGGLLYYHVGVDSKTSTLVNVSIWKTEADAQQMDTLAAMLAQRPVLEGAGVRFEVIVNYLPLWKIEAGWPTS